MKTKKIIWISILLIAFFSILANLGLLQILFTNITAPKFPMDDSFSWRNGKYERIFYGESDAQYIDLYIPKEPVSPRLFVLIHGGGFILNDAQSRQAQLMYRYFRDHGFACASVNYRLAQEAPFPAACEDVHEAVVFLDKHAAEYGYDASEIAIWGESAGGYLSTREALTETDANITMLVSYYGAYDLFASNGQFQKQGISRFIRKVANCWSIWNLGGYDSCEEYWVRKDYAEWTETDYEEVSVQYIAEVSASNPRLRAFLVHGLSDITVPYTQSVDLAEALAVRYGEENVTLTLVDNTIHADDRLYTDEFLSGVAAFIEK